MVNTNKKAPIYINQDLIDLYKQAGIDPATGRPLREEDICNLKAKMMNLLSVKDLQTAIHRYKWYNLPSGLTTEDLERMLYYKHKVSIFYSRINEKMYILPFALSGDIDCYGKYCGITPVCLGSTEDGKSKAFIEGLVLKPVYDYNDIDETSFEEGAVILMDYTPLGVSAQSATPRAFLQQGIIEAESEALPFARTNLIANSGVKGMRVPDDDAQADVEQASKAVTKAALTGKPWIGIRGMQEFQDLTSQGGMATNDYTAYMQTLDNIRLSAYGLSTNGVQTKSAHMLETEQDRNANNDSFVYQDGLSLRQHFCNLVNSIWGLGIWCEPAQTMTGVDAEGDGDLYDETEQTEVNENEPNI